MAGTEKKLDYRDFTTLAKQIDSKIDPDLIKELKEVEVLNIFLKGNMLGNEELIPVGSCVDGSKVTVPGDSGDIDVLIVSNIIILKENLFDYDKEYPAFLHIRVDKEHEKYFKTVKDPIEGVYLPTAVLKELQERLFFVSKVWMNIKTLEGMSKDGNFLNVTRTSAVGKEQMQLYPDEQCTFDFMVNPKTSKTRLKIIEKIAKTSLGRILHLAKNTDKIVDKEGLRTFETNYRSKSLEYENSSLIEMLNRMLNISEGKETGDSNTGNTSKMNGDRQTVASDNGKGDVMRSKENDKDENEKSPDTFGPKLLRGDIYESKLPQDCTATKTKRKLSRSDSDFDHKGEYINAIDSDFGEGDMITTDARIEKPLQHETIKTEASFSQLKSTDFVPAFKFEGWPRVADEWVTRNRKWPSKLTLKKVMESGCQVVAKRPLALYSKPITEDRDPYFRLSFALSEIILAKSMKEQQLLCWRVLKAYQKCFLGTKQKCLTSYHWKNVVFWVSEDLDESFWADENVFMTVIKCLDYMKSCLQNRRLPFYFVPKMNLLNGCDDTLLDKLGKQVEEIRREPLKFLKRFKVETPNSERYLIDIDAIGDKLSEETEAQNMDKLSEEMVDGFISHFPFFCNSGDQIEKGFGQFQNTVTSLNHILKKARSEIEERPSHTAEHTLNSNTLEEKMLDGLEEMVHSIQNEDEKGIFKVFDNLFQSIAQDDNGPDSERASKQRVANMFGTVSSAMADVLKDDGSSENTNNLLASFQKLAMKMQEDFQSKNKTCDEAEENESKETNGMLSTFTGAFPKLIEAIKRSMENTDERVSVAAEFRKVLNEGLQQIGETIGGEDKTEKKFEMDIDLD